MAHACTRSTGKVDGSIPGGCFTEMRFMQPSSNTQHISVPSLLVKSAIQIHTVMSLDRMAWFSSPTSPLVRSLTQVILHLNFHLIIRLRNVGKVLVLQIPSACFNSLRKFEHLHILMKVLKFRNENLGAIQIKKKSLIRVLFLINLINRLK